MSDLAININPRDVGEIAHDLGGTGHDIPVLTIADGVEVVLYEFFLDSVQQVAWLADLSAHALELAALIDAKSAEAAS